MAVGEWKVLERAQKRIGLKEIDFDNDAFQIVLCGDAQAITPDFVGGSGGATYADLTDEIVSAGYTAGGAAMANPTWATDGDYQKWTGDSVSWLALTADVKYAVLVDTTPATDVIVAVSDLDTGGGTGIALAAQDFLITMAANGIVRLRQNPPN